MKPICIYHGACDDGFGAAYCVAMAFGFDGVELYPGVYNRTPPDVSGRPVIMVDFSYKRAVLDEMAATAHSILILDHHKTAAADLAGIAQALRTSHGFKLGSWPSVTALFDMDRSGAGLAWDFFHPNAPRPLFVDYLEDRDLWRKKLPGGDQFTFALRSYPQTLEAWEKLFGSYTSTTRGRDDVSRLMGEGAHIMRYYRAIVEAMKREAYPAMMTVGDDEHVSIAACNAPYAFASEVAGEIIDDGAAFGACYFRRADGRWQYSLRSRGGYDVSKVALRYGGGGHAGAAGFDVEAPVHKASAR